MDNLINNCSVDQTVSYNNNQQVALMSQTKCALFVDRNVMKMYYVDIWIVGVAILIYSYYFDRKFYTSILVLFSITKNRISRKREIKACNVNMLFFWFGRIVNY